MKRIYGDPVRDLLDVLPNRSRAFDIVIDIPRTAASCIPSDVFTGPI